MEALSAGDVLFGDALLTAVLSFNRALQRNSLYWISGVCVCVL